MVGSNVFSLITDNWNKVKETNRDRDREFTYLSDGLCVSVFYCILPVSLTSFDCSRLTVAPFFPTCSVQSLISVLFLILRLSFNLFFCLFLSCFSYTVGILNFRIITPVLPTVGGWLNLLFFRVGFAELHAVHTDVFSTIWGIESLQEIK